LNIERFNRLLRQATLLPVLALLALAAMLYWQIHDANSTVRLIEDANLRVAEVADLERFMIDQETSLRGFQMTGDPHFLQPFQEAEKQIEADLKAIEANSISDPQKKNAAELRSVCSAWRQGFAAPLLATMNAGGQTVDPALNLQGKRLMDAVRAQAGKMIHANVTRRDQRTQLWHVQVHRTAIVLGISALAVGLIIGLFMRHHLRQVSGAFRVSLDELQRRADELFRSEQDLRITLESIGDGVITCDAEGRVQTLNAVAQELTGWTEDEARALPLETIFDIVNESTRQPVENPVARVKRLNRVVGLANHTILRRRDGTEINIDDSGAPIRNRSGDLIGIVLVFRDITLEYKARQALIAQEKLAVAGRLAATIAHEIHNPLDSVSNLLFLMDGNSTPEESRQFLHMAKQELDRVTQISRAMLSLYRESREPVPVDLKEMLESILLLMERRILDLGVTLVPTLPDRLEVRGFPAELRQVFTNLLTNAAEAAGPGGTVHLEVHPRPTGVGEDGIPCAAGVTVTIADDGPGIPVDVRQQLFQPFFTTKGENGTGLGLWVSRGIVTRHGGTISLESDTTPDRHGTRMSVFLAADPIVHPGE
jgi:PAS domain S-box-containing protein